MRIPGFVKNWLIKLVAGQIGKKLEEVDKMEGTKKWYQSKTNLAALVGVVLSVYQIVAVALGPVFGFALPPIPEWLITAAGTILGPIVIYGRNTATEKIG